MVVRNSASGHTREKLRHHRHPFIDIPPHFPANPAQIVRRQNCRFPQIDLEQLAIVHGRLQMIAHQGVESPIRIGIFRGDRRSVRDQLVEQPIQQRRRQRRLVAEMPVDPGAADPGGGADLGEVGRRVAVAGDHLAAASRMRSRRAGSRVRAGLFTTLPPRARSFHAHNAVGPPGRGLDANRSDARMMVNPVHY